MSARVDNLERTVWLLEQYARHFNRAWYGLCESGDTLDRQDLDRLRSARAVLRTIHIGINACAQEIDDLLAMAETHGVHQ